MIYINLIRDRASRGFALLIAVVFTSVVLALGAALLDIAYKQILLASSAKNSQYAFYNADSALECALYWDQKFNAFDFSSPAGGSSIVCDTRAVSSYATNVSGVTRVTTYDSSCAGSGVNATVTIYKKSDGTTDIYANGYNSCNATDPNRIERGLKIHY